MAEKGKMTRSKAGNNNGKGGGIPVRQPPQEQNADAEVEEGEMSEDDFRTGRTETQRRA